MTASPKHRPGPVRGRASGPVQGRFEVVARRREGTYHSLTIQAPDVARRATVGQFVEITSQASATLLRRPFSIAEVAVDGPTGGSVTVVFDVHGPGTAWLSQIGVHDLLDVVGPLGRGFPLPKRAVTCMLVAGGYGAAPLYWLASDLRRSGMRVDMIVGAATRDRLLAPVTAKRVSRTATFTTDDGSYGLAGRVTDALPELAASCGTEVVYAVGPMPMLGAVARVCEELGVPSLVSVEEHMACGIGVCWTCVVPVRQDDGGVRNVRSCVDGPVMAGAEVAWERTRWAPAVPVAPEEPPSPPRPTAQELFG